LSGLQRIVENDANVQDEPSDADGNTASDAEGDSGESGSAE
jgi:hypothetical protein